MTIVGANTGDVCRVPMELPEHFVCQSVALVRPIEPRTSRSIELFLVSPENGRKQFDEFMYGQGRPHLSFDQLKATLIALPPLAEQHRIVAEVERRLSIADEVAATVEAARARAARLRQSVLKRAFAGKLVPQDPNDEPASALLTRIRAGRERAEAKPSKKMRGAVTASVASESKDRRLRGQRRGDPAAEKDRGTRRV